MVYFERVNFDWFFECFECFEIFRELIRICFFKMDYLVFNIIFLLSCCVVEFEIVGCGGGSSSI